MKSLTSAEVLISYFKKINRPLEFETPEFLIMCYQSHLWEYIIKHHNGSLYHRLNTSLLILNEMDGRIGVLGEFGIGAPNTAFIIENFACLGAKFFLAIGTAGGIQPFLKPGDIIIPDRALRDEGISRHYLPPSPYSYPNSAMQHQLITYCQQNTIPYHEGTTWTTDAVYRETHEEISFYRQSGVLSVEMECAALFAVAAYRHVAATALFTISDILSENWSPNFALMPKYLQRLISIGVEFYTTLKHPT